MPWAIVALAAFLRFLLLGMKPPHFDEGINGWFVDQMVKNGFYRYDPTNYHGPLHFYVLFLSQTLLGRNIWALRLPVVLISIFCVWLTLKFEPFVGRNVSRLAALAMAISPGFVFYGRYSIHEIWLQLFSMLFILGLLGLWRRGTTNYLWCAGHGIDRHDPDQGDLHHPCRLRRHRDLRHLDFASAESRAERQARAANLELSGSSRWSFAVGAGR